MPQIDQPIYGELRPRVFRVVPKRGPVDPEHPVIPEDIVLEGAIAKQVGAIANSSATDIAGVNAKINEILGALRASGIIAS